MEEHTLASHNGRTVTLDLCVPCQSFWFDARESLALTPASTLALDSDAAVASGDSTKASTRKAPSSAKNGCAAASAIVLTAAAPEP